MQCFRKQFWATRNQFTNCLFVIEAFGGTCMENDNDMASLPVGFTE